MHLTASELGVLFLLLFGLFHWLGIFASARAVIAFLGVVILGSAGFAGRMIATVAAWAQHAFGSVTSWLFGGAAVAGLFVILAVIFVHDLHPRNKAGKRTGWIALALGAVVVAGVAGIPALSGLRGGIVHIVGGITSAVNGAVG